MKSLQEQRRNHQLCDVKIICGGRTFYAHSCVLAGVSSYCRALFLGSFAEQENIGHYQVDLSEFSESSMQLLLDIVYYADRIDTMHIDMIDFIQLVDYLQLKMDFVIAELFRRKISLSNCLELYQGCTQFNAIKLKQLVSIFIGSRFVEVYKKDEWQKMSKELRFSLIQSPSIHCYPKKILAEAADCDVRCVNSLIPRGSKRYEHSLVLLGYFENNNQYLIDSRAIADKNLILDVNYITPYLMHSERKTFYFTYRFQMFVAIIEQTNQKLVVERYDQMHKAYVKCTMKDMKDIAHTADWIYAIFENLREELVYLIFVVRREEQADLRKVHIVSMDMTTYDVKESMTVLVDMDGIHEPVFRQKNNSIYFIGFDISVYNLKSKHLTVHQDVSLDINEEDEITTSRVICQDDIYCFASDLMNYVKVFKLDVKEMSWMLCTEYRLTRSLYGFQALVSCGKIYMVLFSDTEHVGSASRRFKSTIMLYDRMSNTLSEEVSFDQDDEYHVAIPIPKHVLEIELTV